MARQLGTSGDDGRYTGPREFTTTHWSVVLRAGRLDSPEAKEALEQLCLQYWYPLYAYLRRKGKTPEDAADLTQDFFAKLIQADFPAGIRPEGGRFRSFLLTALNRFVINDWEKGMRQKRGGGAKVLSLDGLISQLGEAKRSAKFRVTHCGARSVEKT